jgi:hypothetical protein
MQTLSSQFRTGGLAFSPHIRQMASATTVDDLRAILATVENREICGLDRLLKQRFALRKPDFSFDFSPPRGGLGSLSVGADCLAAKSRARPELLS